MVIMSWYIAIIAPRTFCGEISDRYRGAVKEATPTAMPRMNRAPMRIFALVAEGAEQRTDDEDQRAEQDRLPPAEVAGEIAASQRAADRTPQQRADDRFHRPIVEMEILLDELLRAGDHAHIQPEKEPGQGGGEADKINDGADFSDERGMHGVKKLERQESANDAGRSFLPREAIRVKMVLRKASFR